MATYPIIPSESISGQPIHITATATPGTNVHIATSSTGAGQLDEVYLYAMNRHSANVNVIVECGSYNASHNIYTAVSPGAGLTPILPGLRINNAKVISVFASTANVINITAVVNRRE